MGSLVEKELRSGAAAVGAVGGKTARACDGCLRRRARWYCAADDAFLCQGCDVAVHSANPLARRHERLRLCEPAQRPLAWFTRKARTPRPHHHHHHQQHGKLVSGGAAVGAAAGDAAGKQLVPQITAGESSEEKNDEAEGEEQLLYQVPIFDPALAEFRSPPPPLEESIAAGCCSKADADESLIQPAGDPMTVMSLFGPSDAELREFAADMESLLGHGLNDGGQEESFYMETLGLMDAAGDDDGAQVKAEFDSGESVMDFAAELELEPEGSGDQILDFNFNCGSPMAIEEEDEYDDEAEVDRKDDDDKASILPPSAAIASCRASSATVRQLTLKLDYESIIGSWSSMPWIDGERPQLKLDDWWPLIGCSGVWMPGCSGHGEESSSLVHRLNGGPDGGREARVTRYREKRRTRLFSKKIRYEVRKLNAEKRPRMKGRFVKRCTAA